VLGVTPHAALVERAAASLAARPGRRFELGTDGSENTQWPEGLRRAAVAVMIVERGGEARIPLIVRGHDAPVHSSQVALPGGRAEPGDADIIATARREAFEELAVPLDAPVVLGTLDDVPTPSGFMVTPVVFSLADHIPFTPCEREVAGWFEVPLDLFADTSIAEVIGEREWRGIMYTLRGYPFGDRKIWGATARILEDLAARVR
jgi:8-oxo-dGTP pyrophosphatase MutT (NUDIX family)